MSDSLSLSSSYELKSGLYSLEEFSLLSKSILREERKMARIYKKVSLLILIFFASDFLHAKRFINFLHISFWFSLSSSFILPWDSSSSTFILSFDLMMMPVSGVSLWGLHLHSLLTNFCKQTSSVSSPHDVLLLIFNAFLPSCSLSWR